MGTKLSTNDPSIWFWPQVCQKIDWAISIIRQCLLLRKVGINKTLYLYICIRNWPDMQAHQPPTELRVRVSCTMASWLQVLFYNKKISLGAQTLLENLPDPRVGNLIFGFSANCSFALFKRAMRGIRSRHLLKKSNSLSFVFIRAKPKVKSDKSDSHVVL